MLQVGATPQWMFADKRVRAEDEREADDHQQQLRGEVDDREADVQPRRLAHPTMLIRTSTTMTAAPTMMSHGVVFSGPQKIDR